MSEDTNTEENAEPVAYPLANDPEAVATPDGVPMSDITLDALLAGEVAGEDVRITADTLEKQARVAEENGRPQVARNFRRAAELTAVPDDRILEIYNALRPSGAEKEALLDIADELESEYGATINAAHVREAAEIYETRGLY
ncbi:diol dehydratase small subunit [Halegenticoccus tardaugens]|uniref:diol dehydratase small subunit n=1 Tax=Halegenticoccus tardaugens TaxID=2071624 RepID=UPI00100A4120|nr:diol dehydratase small subunit [Halegenticoccus tardaugens]